MRVCSGSSLDLLKEFDSFVFFLSPPSFGIRVMIYDVHMCVNLVTFYLSFCLVSCELG